MNGEIYTKTLKFFIKENISDFKISKSERDGLYIEWINSERNWVDTFTKIPYLYRASSKNESVLMLLKILKINQDMVYFIN